MLCADHKEEGLQERGETRVNIQGLGEGEGGGGLVKGALIIHIYIHIFLILFQDICQMKVTGFGFLPIKTKKDWINIHN